MRSKEFGCNRLTVAFCAMRRLYENASAVCIAKLQAACDLIASWVPEGRQSAWLAAFAAFLMGVYGFSATDPLTHQNNSNESVITSNSDIEDPGLPRDIPSALQLQALDDTESDGMQENKSADAFNLTSLDLDRQDLLIASAAQSKSVPAPVHKTLEVELGRGDTLMAVLVRGGVPQQEAYEAIQALKPTLDPRRLKAGQKLSYTLQRDPEQKAKAGPFRGLDMTLPSPKPFAPRLLRLDIETDVDRRIVVNRTSETTFEIKEVIAELEERFVRAGGKIKSSLFLAAQAAGVPSRIVFDLIRMYSYDVDFQREIRKGDTFEVFFTQYVDKDGTTIKTGDIHFGSLMLRKRSYIYYRYTTPDDGVTGYYDVNGQSSRKFLMKTPVDGARISSGFGQRRHPILGYNKMHQGVDFAAPRGTPIMAAGHGVVERASRYGSFGNYIRIRHANGYKTAYAHLKSYAKGVRKGSRVRQGQVIGYVGTTGRSTGPHLHYEVLYNGKHVNPLKIRVPTGRKLSGKHLEAFLAERGEIDRQMANISVASRLTTAQLD